MLKKVLSIGALTLSFLGVAQAYRSEGSCQTVDTQENFDATKYIGTWYEQFRDKTIQYEFFDCNQAHYSLNADNTIAVHNTEYDVVSGKFNGAEAVAKCNGPLCKVYFSPQFGGDYRVISTDYSNYAIVYSCEDNLPFSVPGFKDDYLWILSRETVLDEEIN